MNSDELQNNDSQDIGVPNTPNPAHRVSVTRNREPFLCDIKLCPHNAPGHLIRGFLLWCKWVLICDRGKVRASAGRLSFWLVRGGDRNEPWYLRKHDQPFWPQLLCRRRRINYKYRRMVRLVDRPGFLQF